MKFKDYPQRYEKRFSSDRTLKNCNFDDVSTDFNINNEEYKKKMGKLYFNFQKDIFDYLVKMQWLKRRFCYRGTMREKDGQNGFFFDSAFCVFVRNFIGVEPRMLVLSREYMKVISYFDDFFPNFNIENPFKIKYKFPYKNITMDFLLTVYQIPCRLKILDAVEKKKLSYAKFLDFVFNYISSENERHDKDIFGMFYPQAWTPPYVIFYKENYEESRKQSREHETSSVRKRKI